VTGELRGIRRVHFVGIGGIGMCGLAELLAGLGVAVSGSDLQEGGTVARLRQLGIPVAIGHDASQLGEADVVVVSSAIRAGNPEVQAALGQGIPVVPRAEMLAELMRLREGIAVAGTHGKTTTTSMIAHVLDAAGLDPTVVVGGRVMQRSGRQEDRTGARLGEGAFLVAEADESDGSFLRLAPVIAVVTNVEPEHLDHYGSADALDDAFLAFLERLPFWGRAVVCLDHPGVKRLLPRLTRRRVTYGFEAQADWVASTPRPEGAGQRFQVRRGDHEQGTLTLPVPGLHNAANALAALAVAAEVEVPFARAAEALAGFPGVERRFETIGRQAGVTVVDDYGHHPTEVRATLEAARSIHAGRIVVVFQPHRYTRTRDLFDDFSSAFHDADLLLVTEVYAAGEDKIPGAEGATLAEAIRSHGHRRVEFVADLERIAELLPAELRPDDLVLTLGAGDVRRVGPQLLERLAEDAR
jgi:UDP-N-acetylmuramate--alanine ligase